MPLYLAVGGVVVAAVGSLFFSALTYALRDFSRGRMSDFLRRHRRQRWIDSILDHDADLIFVTAIGRQVATILLWISMFAAVEDSPHGTLFRYLVMVVVAGIISLLFSVVIPHALARWAAEPIIGVFAPFLHALRLGLAPLTKLMHFVDDAVRRAVGAPEESEPEQIEEEILSAVEEGEKEGVVDEQEREMIESVIEFRDTTAGEIMTPRTEIVAIELGAGLQTVKTEVERSGHSRIPVYNGTLDQIVGILYARDLIKHLGAPPDQFDICSAMRPAFYVPETRPLRDLLKDFRQQKVHIAIVLDEYGGTAGLVTIEDLLEELVGEISDEHEPQEQPMIRKIDERTWDVDATARVEDLNLAINLALPEEGGFETLGGFLSTNLGRVPATGTEYEHNGVKYKVLDAEPQKVKRVRVELPAQSSAEAVEAETSNQRA